MTSLEEGREGEFETNPLVYYQKPAIGQSNGNNSSGSPVQIVFPAGGFGIGLSPKEEGPESRVDNVSHGVMASAPSDSPMDLFERRNLIIAFIAMALLNLIITILLFYNAHDVDPSTVEKSAGGIPSAFEEISYSRRPSEKLNFGFTLFFLIIGAISAWSQNALGMSLYCIGIISLFFLGTSSLPSFAYALRYVLDVFMVYVGLVLRTRFMYSYLPLHLHRY